MITLRTGRFRNIEECFLADFLAARQSDPLTPLLVVIPSGAIRTRLQKQLVQSDSTNSILNTSFLDIYGLANRLLSEGSPHKERVIREPALYAELIRDLLEDRGDFPLQLRSELHAPGKPLLDGLPRALAGTLRDLRDSGARVVDSLNVALEGHLGDEAGEAAPTLELYARVYETLQSRGLRTPADLLRWTKDQLPRSEFFKSQKAVFFYGFYDLTGVQLDLLLGLLNHPQAYLYFPYEEKPAYAFAERLLKDPALSARLTTGGRADGGTTAKSLAVDLSPSHPVSPSIEVWSCSGARDEVWATAKEILKLVDAGTSYDQILLTARSLAPYIDTVEEIFTANHIPFSMDVEHPVGAFPLLKAARLLLTLDRDAASASTMTDLLRSPYFQPTWRHSALGERLIQQSGIVRGWSSWRERLNSWIRRPAPADFPNAASIARELLSVVESLERELTVDKDQEMTWTQHVEWARAVLTRRLSLPRDASFRERILWKELLNGLLESLSALDAMGKNVARERFLRVWEEKLEDWKVSFSQGPRAGVQVMDVMAARGLSFDSVFLMGMNEKSFPRLIREDPFLSDIARSTLARALGCRLARKMDGYQEERLLVELVRSSAEHALFISFQRSDEEGKALVPSLYLQSFTPAHTRIIPRPPVEKWRAAPSSSLTPKELSVLWNRDHRDTAHLYPMIRADKETYEVLIRFQNILEEMKPMIGPLDGAVGRQSAVQERFDRGLSPDSLKDLAECPFRYFSGKILELSNQIYADKDEGDLARDTSGILIHKILENFYSSFGERSLKEVSESEKESQLKKAFERSFATLKETGLDIYPLVMEAQRQLIWERLQTFIKKDWSELIENNFKPIFFESEIDGSIPELSEGLNSFQFHGRVDRIDLQPQAAGVRFRVIDYKTGKVSPKTSDGEKAVLKGLHPQLPIYLGMAGPWLSKKLGKPAEAEGAHFYNLSDWEAGRESPSLAPVFWESYGRAYSENLGSWLNLAQKGIFFIRPSDERGYCRWCAYATLCRKEHKPTSWRSEHSRERQSMEETVKKNGARVHPENL